MEYYELSSSAAVGELNTDPKNGLSEQEAQKRLLTYGKNRLDDKKKKSVIRRFFEQFNDFMIIILLCAAAVSLVTSFLSGDADITEAIIILAIVTLNALLGTVQEMRAEHSLEALKKLSSPTVRVIRNSREQRINSEDIVPGDIIKLRRGDIVSADCRLIHCDNFSVDESSLTGETNEVEKDADIVHSSPTALGDIKNMVLSSSAVTSGTATAAVVHTGMDTEVGKIASMIIETDDIKTPLQKRLANIGKTLGIAALFICGVIFIIGTFKKIPPFEMFMTSVSLAVAAIPEGLPAIVTILLALGVIRMSKHNAIVRHLPSVETLGCATVICTDKTGTLTQNKMKAEKIKTEDTLELLRLSVLCSEEGDCINPTDQAIVECAVSHGIDAEKYREAHPITSQIPFDSVRKRMSAAADDKIIVKGALEYILPLCTRYLSKKDIIPFSSQLKRKVIKENELMTDNALRVIAVAYKPEKLHGPIDEKDETELIFVGLIGIYDPPRPEAKAAVMTAAKAGVRTIMVTGDHANTALAIAKKTGIATDGQKAVTGQELDKMTDDELEESVKSCNVFARVTPEHKLRIVKALKNNGEITAMTGDGVNDAPALRGADIGCSMGINGTDVAKSASDMILTDDNFATIVYAVGEGRSIYDNIKKSVQFLLSSNIGEILTVMFGIIFGCGSPLTAIELLWINLVTDSLPAIALGLDPADKNIMNRPPVNPKKGILGPGLWAAIMLEGLMIGALSLFAYSLGLWITCNIDIARTMAFFTLGVSQLTHAFNMRSSESVIKNGIFKNKYLVFSFIAGLSAQCILIYINGVSRIFGICALNPLCFGIVLLLSVMPLVLVELQKLINSRFRK